MILELTTEDELILHRPTIEVKEITEITREFVSNLLKTMRNKEGMGLAANQVGSELRIAVIENKKLLSHPLVMINPKILELSVEQEDECEGCLSIPKKGFVVRRAKWVIFEYTDKNGKLKTFKAKNLLARIVLHEFDHLLGMTIRDRAEEVEAVREFANCE
jgi:peptide deformylase